MANRIKLTVLGATLAPYTSLSGISIGSPTLINGGISEQWSLDISQLQRGVDTTTTQRALYPLALSSVVIKYVNANHFETSTVFITIDSTALNTLANA